MHADDRTPLAGTNPATRNDESATAGQHSRRELLRNGVYLGGALLVGALGLGCSRRAGGNSAAYQRAQQTVLAQAGQTLGIIAAAYQVPLHVAVEMNPRLPLGTLQEGTRVQLPLVAKQAPVPTPAAPAHVEPFPIISRAQWGAQPMRSNFDPMHGIDRMTIHHTAELPGMTTNNDQTTVLNVQRLHLGRGWADIGYHYIVGRDGQVYAGRPITAQGAHAGNNLLNKHNLGIVLIGDFMTTRPSSAQLAKLSTMMTYYQDRFRIPISRVYGHRDLKPTLCPGIHLYNWLQNDKRSRAA